MGNAIVNKPRYWSDFLPALREKAVDEALGSVFFRNEPLNKWLRKVLSGGKGEQVRIVGDPVFEPMFAWKMSGKTMQQLGEEGVVREATVNALGDRAGHELYTHQYRALCNLLDKKRTRSVIISSGTGSGKTECFMYPMLEDLVAELEDAHPYRRGMRALFLYPLNALIESQKERLDEITKTFGGKLKYVLYNGALPENDKAPKEPQPEIVDRTSMREMIPQIMVSNPSMIERMILREKDAPIINATRKAKSFRWVVIDEAHTYTGSKAAELALLIRRFLNRIDCDPRSVHFVCTSATMNVSERERVTKFLTDLAGADPANVELIEGERQLPREVDLSKLSLDGAPGLDELTAMENGKPLVDALKRSPVAMFIRNAFIHDGAIQLSKLRNAVYANGWGDLSEEEVLRWIDLLTRPVNVNFLPLRIHLPLNTVGRIMACPDSQCRFRDEELQDPRWKFGQCYLDERASCSCGAPLFPVAACSECNAVYLKASKVADPDDFDFVLVPPDSLESDMALWDSVERSGVVEVSANAGNSDGEDDRASAEDADVDLSVEELAGDFSSDRELLEKQTDEDLSIEVTASAPAELSEVSSPEADGEEAEAETMPEPSVPVLITQDGDAFMTAVVKWTDGEGNEHRIENVRFVEPDMSEDDERPAALRRITCPDCLTELMPAYFYIRGISDKYVRALLPFVLEYCAGGEEDDVRARRPMDGSRLLTFTDSRPQTAENSALIEREGERSFTVTHLMRKIAGPLTPADQKAIDKLQGRINKFSADPDPDMQEMVEDLKADLAKLTQRHVAWSALKEAIRKQIPNGENENEFAAQLLRSVWMRFDDGKKPGEYSAERADTIAETLMMREFGFRPKNGVSLETCGVIRVDYAGIEKVTEAPSQWTSRGFTLDDWKKFLKLIMDYEVRGNFCCKVPDKWKKIGGDKRIRPKVMLPPGTEDAGSMERTWPQLKRSAAKSAHPNVRRIVRYLAALLNVPLDGTATDEDIDTVNAVFRHAYLALTNHRVLTTADIGNRGFRLDFEDQVVLVRNDFAWRFEKNKQLFDTIIGDPATAPCPQVPLLRGAEKVSLPEPCTDMELFHATRSVFREGFRQHLEKQDAYRKLIDAGNWNRIGTYAFEHVSYFSSAEHSAQVDNEVRKDQTQRFKDGFINVLCSSTTMEMGVDIGGLNTVLMNGVPPHASNYLQRAGRAGRSKETRANVLAVCRNTARDREVFCNPLWAIKAGQPSLAVSLGSRIIVQRHVNAQLFTDFILEHNLESEALPLSAWLSECQDQFEDWLTSLDRESVTAQRVRRFTKGTILAPASVTELANTARTDLLKIIKEWNKTRERYVQRMLQIGDPNTAGYKALKYQCDRFLATDVYSRLVTDLWLPSSIRVTNVVEFDALSERDVSKLVARKKQELAAKKGPKLSEQALENLVRSEHPNPTRENHVGIFEYAPGATLIMDHQVFTSTGLILNSRRPEEKDAGRIEERRRIMKCPYCGQISLTTIAEGLTCPFCDRILSPDEANIEEVIIPKGFSVRADHEATKNINDKVRYPRESAVLSIDEPWENVGADDAVLFRMSERGTLISCNHGRAGQGFDVCLACGWAQPHDPDSDLRHYPHRPISPTYLDSEGFCNSHLPGRTYLIQRNIFIAAESRTDCFSLSIRIDPSFRKWQGKLFKEHVRSAGIAVSVMLRRVIARYFSIEEDEIAFTPPQILRNRLIVSFYDRLNGGYCSRVAPHLGEFLRETRQGLAHCPSKCRDACINCILTFDTGRIGYKLSRFDGVQLLSDDVMNSLNIPEHYRDVFGADVRLQTGRFENAVLFMAEMQAKSKLRFFVEKPNEDEPLEGTDLVQLIRRLKYTLPGSAVKLVAKDFSWRDLSSEQQTRLSGLIDLGVCFGRVDGMKQPACVEIASDTHSPEVLSAVRFGDSEETEPVDGWNWSGEGVTVLMGSTALPDTKPDDAPIYHQPIVEVPPTDSTVIHDFAPEGGLTTVNFGTTFFDACAKKLGFDSLAKWIEGPSENTETVVEEVIYNDRFLERVIDPVLVLSLFKAVAATRKLKKDCRMTMRTTDPSSRVNRPGLPYMLQHYWNSEEVRSNIFAALKKHLCIRDEFLAGVPVSLACEDNSTTFHDRRLSIRLSDGRTLWFMIGRGISVFLLDQTKIEGIRNPDESEIGYYLYLLLQPTSSVRRTKLFFNPEEAIISVWTKAGED